MLVLLDDVFDLAIIGAGPAGMSAAIEASQEGLSVVLFDDQASPGGQIYRDIEFCPQDRLAVLGPSYEAGLALVARFRQAKIEYRPLHPVWSVDHNGLLYTSSEGSARRWRWRRLIVATGAMERAVPRKGWLLPGVRTVGSAQIMLKSGGFLPQEDTWIVGSGPLPLLFLNQLHNAGVRIAGYVDTTPYANYVNALGDMPSAFSNVKALWTGLKYQWRALRTGMRYVTGASEIAVDGDDRVSSLSFTTLGRRQQYKTGTVLVHDGVVPSVRVAGAIGCELEWNNTQRYFRPKINDDGRSSRDHVFFAGDAGGIEGAEAAESAGRIAALAIIQDLRGSDDVLSSRSISWKKRRASARSVRPFLDSLYAPEKSAALSDDTLVVCRCEGVTVGAIRTAARAGAKGVNEVKAYTRAGMGPCQGSICAQIVSEIVANELGLGHIETGIFRTRPPIRAITVEQLSSL